MSDPTEPRSDPARPADDLRSPAGSPLDRAVAAAMRSLDDLGEAVFERLRGNRLADRVFYSASEAGDFSLLWHTIGAGRALLPGGRVSDAVRLSAMLGVESALVNGLLKSLVRRERPVDDVERPHHLRIPLTSSFPSGHASSAFMAASLLAERDRALGPLYAALAAVVALSRIHVRIHHGSDVVAGAALGVALGAIARRAWRIER